MKKILFYLIVLLATSAAAQTKPTPGLLTPHSAEYKVRMSGLSGRLNTTLLPTPEGFEARHIVRPSGIARIFSSGTIDETASFVANPTGVSPLRYRSNDELTRDKTRADIRFDWAAGLAVGTLNEQPFEREIDGLAHDRVSIQYELMRDLLSGAASAEYQLFETDEMKQLEVEIVGEREVSVGAGRFDVVGIRHRSTGSSRTTTLWCAAELDYLPVIIEQHKDGKRRMRATLETYAPQSL